MRASIIDPCQPAERSSTVKSCWTWTAGCSCMTSRGCRQQRDNRQGWWWLHDRRNISSSINQSSTSATSQSLEPYACRCALSADDTPCRAGSSSSRRLVEASGRRLWILNIERPSLLFDLHQLLRIQPFMYAFPMDSSSASTSQRLVLARKKNDRTVGVNLYRRVWARRVDVCSYMPRRVDAHAPFRDCRFVLVRFGFVTAQFWGFRFLVARCWRHQRIFLISCWWSR